MTIKEWIDYWMEVYDKSNVRRTTYEARRYICQNHIIPGLGNIQLTELTEDDVGRFLEDRKHHGNHRPESKSYPEMSDESMLHLHRLLRQCLNQAVRDGLIEKNPADAFRYPKTQAVKANVLTALEAENYMDAAEELDCLPMFNLALMSGLRQRELIALKWSDLDVTKRILTIHKGRVVERCELIDYGGTTREILLPQETAVLLEQEYLRHPNSPYLFPHPGTQKPYSPNMVRLLHNRIIEHSGLDHIRFTDLRHTFAVLTLREGVELSALTETLGLARRYMTKKNYEMYLPGNGQNAPVSGECAPSSEDMRQAADRLENLLNF
ncbi:MAG: site-specific integrase [Clostridia bacterium]|nr:site-specific integrase [Clostridia bacterium]